KAPKIWTATTKFIVVGESEFGDSMWARHDSQPQTSENKKSLNFSFLGCVMSLSQTLAPATKFCTKNGMRIRISAMRWLLPSKNDTIKVKQTWGWIIICFAAG